MSRSVKRPHSRSAKILSESRRLSTISVREQDAYRTGEQECRACLAEAVEVIPSGTEVAFAADAAMTRPSFA